MRRGKQILSILLALTLLMQFVPAVLAAGGKIFVTVNDQVVVSDGRPGPEQYPGVSYDAVTATLTLENVQASTLEITGAGTVAVRLKGDNTITSSNPERTAVLFQEGTFITLTGPGTLHATSQENAAVGLNHSKLHITDGAQLIAEGIGAEGSLTAAGIQGWGEVLADGNASVRAEGRWMGYLVHGNTTLENCTLQTNRMHIHSQFDDPQDPEGTSHHNVTRIGAGAALTVEPLPGDDPNDTLLMLLDGSRLHIDGGDVIVRDTFTEGWGTAVGTLHGNTIEVDAGTMQIASRQKNALILEQDNTFVQRGGKVHIELIGKSQDAEDFDECAIVLHKNSQMTQLGGELVASVVPSPRAANAQAMLLLEGSAFTLENGSADFGISDPMADAEDGRIPAVLVFPQAALTVNGGTLTAQGGFGMNLYGGRYVQNNGDVLMKSSTGGPGVYANEKADTRNALPSFVLNGGSFTAEGGYAMDIDAGDMLVNGGMLHVSSTPREAAGASISCGLHMGGNLRMTGGEARLHADGTDWSAALFVTGPSGSAEISGGSLYAEGGTHGIVAEYGSIFGIHAPAVVHAKGFADSEASGTASYGIWNEGSFTVYDGTLQAAGDNRGLAQYGGRADFLVLDGTVTLEAPMQKSEQVTRFGVLTDSPMRLMGGSVCMRGANLSVLGRGADVNHITLGKGMLVRDNDTNKAPAPYLDIQRGEHGYASDNITISGEGGSYYGVLDLPHGMPRVGVAAAVRGVFHLEAPTGTMRAILPEGVEYVTDSLTINSKPVQADPTKEAIAIETGDVVRFSVLPLTAGTSALTAEITAGQAAHTESVTISAKAFDLNLPTSTRETTLPVTGIAHPGVKVELYDGGVLIGTADTNALGSWRTTITLANTKTGIHPISAKLHANGKEIWTDPFVLHYEPDTVQVESLTVKNMIHGAKSTDPDVPVVSVIRFDRPEENTPHYIYWPDRPTFDFTVRFTADSDISQVGQVAVITTDCYGTETRTPMEKQTDGTWTGQGIFNDRDAYAPELFRVEWFDAGESGAEPDIPVSPERPSPKPAAPPQESVNDQSTGYHVKVPAGQNFRTELSAGAVCKVWDGMGNEITEAVVADGVVLLTEDPGRLYTVALTSGKFTDAAYQDSQKLFVSFAGTPNTPGGYQYTDRVILVDSIGSSAGYKPGDVLVCEATREAMTVQPDGQLAQAGLSEIFDKLIFSNADLVGAELRTDRIKLEEIEAQIAASPFSQALLSAIDQTARELQLSLTIGKDAPVHVQYDVEHSKQDYPMIVTENKTLVIGVDIKDEKGVSVPFELTIQDKRTDEINVSFVYDKEKGDQIQSMYHTTTITNEMQVGISFGLSISQPLKDKFTEKLGERILEKIDKKELDDLCFTLGEVYIPIPSIPLVEFFIRGECELDYSLSGLLQYNVTQTNATEIGMVYHAVDSSFFNPEAIEAYTKPAEPQATGFDMTMHAAVDLTPKLTGHSGFRIALVAEVSLYAELGLHTSFGGHGSINTDPSDLHFYFVSKLVLDTGVSAEIGFADTTIFEAGLSVYSWEKPLKEFGDRIMPTAFASKEKQPILLRGNGTLEGKVDKELMYQMFGAEDSAISEGQKVFTEGTYTYQPVDCPPGITVQEDGTVTFENVPKGTEFQVELRYQDGEAYLLYKTFLCKYDPDAVILHKSIDHYNKSAGFHVTDLTTGKAVGNVVTNAVGYGSFTGEADHLYQVTETYCQPGYRPTTAVQHVKAGQEATFLNVKKEKPEPHATQNAERDVGRDPAGFVYEGMESNRVSGVTTTVYYSAYPDGSGKVQWNAADYGQENPLQTNLYGQYQWMVPAGYWQVKYEKPGFETQYSAWLPVPPVQTEVNIGLVRKGPAVVSAKPDPQLPGVVILTFDRPVYTETVTQDTVQFVLNGTPLASGTYSVLPLDPNWEGGADLTAAGAEAPRTLATQFCLQPNGLIDADGSWKPLPDGKLTISGQEILTYAGTATAFTTELQVINRPVLPDKMEILIPSEGYTYNGMSIEKPEVLIPNMTVDQSAVVYTYTQNGLPVENPVHAGDYMVHARYETDFAIYVSEKAFTIAKAPQKALTESLSVAKAGELILTAESFQVLAEKTGAVFTAADTAKLDDAAMTAVLTDGRLTVTVKNADKPSTGEITLTVASDNYQDFLLTVKFTIDPAFVVVTFDPAGGTVSPATMKTEADGTLASLPDAFRADYAFKGWFLPDGTMVTTKTIFTKAETVSAKWEPLQKPDQTYPVKPDGSGIYHRGSGQDLHLQVDANAHQLKKVLVDGKEISTAHYTVQGSTVVLHAAYLETLSAGTHTVTLVYANGTASTVLTVQSAAVVPPSETPPTGDATPWMLLISLSLLSLFGALSVLTYKRKRF